MEKCFDALWMHEYINDIFDAGLQNDKLSLLFKENEKSRVGIKTDGKVSKTLTIEDIVMQGPVWGFLCCTTSMDKIGQMAYKNNEML